MNPIVSIIVPVYNTSSKLSDCMIALTSQTLKDIEIILVNDGSTDNSPVLCQEWAEKDQRIKVIHKENGGVSTARNAGIEAACGEYVMFVDSDDTLETDACKRMYEIISEKNVDLLVASYYTVYNDEVMLHKCKNAVYKNVQEIAFDFDNLYMDCFLNSPWNKMYRRDLMNCRFLDDMRYFEDYYFNLDYIDDINSLATTEYAYYHYVEDNSQSLTKVFRDDIFDVFIKIYHRQLDFCHKYFSEQFDDYLKMSLLYGLYNSAQKLVFSSENKNKKINMISNWMNCKDIQDAFNSETLQNHLNIHANKQQKIAFNLIEKKKSKQLYRVLIVKQKALPILIKIKNIIKGRKSRNSLKS